MLSLHLAILAMSGVVIKNCYSVLLIWHLFLRFYRYNGVNYRALTHFGKPIHSHSFLRRNNEFCYHLILHLIFYEFYPDIICEANH